MKIMGDFGGILKFIRRNQKEDVNICFPKKHMKTPARILRPFPAEIK